MLTDKQKTLGGMSPGAVVLLILLANCSAREFAVTSAERTVSPAGQSTYTPSTFTMVQVVSMDDAFPDGIFQFEPSFAEVPAGVYLLGFSRDQFAYTLLDGESSGYIGSLVDVSGYYQGDYKYTGDYSSNADFYDPEYMGVSARQINVPEDGKISYWIADMLVQSVSLRSMENHAWVVYFPDNAGIFCRDVSLAPNHMWIAGTCLQDKEYQIYFLNIQEQTFNVRHANANRCQSASSTAGGWGYFNWSPNGDWLIATCVETESPFTCLVSARTGEFYCPDPSGELRGVIAWSPKGNMVVVSENDTLVVKDRTCLQNAQPCQVYLETPILHKSEYYSVSSVWNWDGTTVLWSYYDNWTDSSGYATICVGNMDTGEQNCFDGPQGTDILSISPDGKWLEIAFQDSENIPIHGLLSVDGSVLRRDLDGWGWLVVP